MNKVDIKAAIDRAGTSQAAIAKYLKITPACVGRVMAGTMRSKRVEDELEKLIGKKIFGESKKAGRTKTTYKGEAQQVAA
jgi:ribosome-binding protein aMBF1 (putative translation factor)